MLDVGERISGMNEKVADKAQAFYDGDYTNKLLRGVPTMELRRTFLFKPYLTDQDRVLDFGCGPGELLMTLPGKDKCGVEISEVSAQQAREKGIHVVADLGELKGREFDKIISAHALEHVVDPAAKLVQMRELLPDNGKLILVLPINEWVNRKQRKWKADDRDKHLYTWTPLLIGNLLTVCGFEPLEIRVIHHFHPPKIGNLLAKTFLYHPAAMLASRLVRKRQLIAVARVAD